MSVFRSYKITPAHPFLSDSLCSGRRQHDFDVCVSWWHTFAIWFVSCQSSIICITSGVCESWHSMCGIFLPPLNKTKWREVPSHFLYIYHAFLLDYSVDITTIRSWVLRYKPTLCALISALCHMAVCLAAHIPHKVQTTRSLVITAGFRLGLYTMNCSRNCRTKNIA